MREAIKTDNKHANAYNYLGYLFADKGINLDEAVELVKKALEIEPENGFFLDSLGWAYFKKGEIKLAREKILEAIKFSPNDPTIREHMGDIYIKLNQKEMAISEWKKSLEIDSKNAGAKKKLNEIMPPNPK